MRMGAMTVKQCRVGSAHAGAGACVVTSDNGFHVCVQDKLAVLLAVMQGLVRKLTLCSSVAHHNRMPQLGSALPKGQGRGTRALGHGSGSSNLTVLPHMYMRLQGGFLMVMNHHFGGFLLVRPPGLSVALPGNLGVRLSVQSLLFARSPASAGGDVVSG